MANDEQEIKKMRGLEIRDSQKKITEYASNTKPRNVNIKKEKESNQNSALELL